MKLKQKLSLYSFCVHIGEFVEFAYISHAISCYRVVFQCDLTCLILVRVTAIITF